MKKKQEDETIPLSTKMLTMMIDMSSYNVNKQFDHLPRENKEN